MEIWELTARELIRDTVVRYAHCADGGRFEEMVELFTEDGVLEIEGREPLRGRDAIRDFLTGTRTSLATTLARPFIRHHVSSLQIDLDGPDEARAASYFLAITERGPDHWGRYRDQLVRAGERWLFRRRRVRPDGHAPGSWRASRAEKA